MGEQDAKGVALGFDATLAGNAPAPPTETAVRRGTSIGRYVVIDRIGAGGMGEVFVAFDPDLDRKVALKLVKPGGADAQRRERARARLVREGQAMAKLSHPNVIPVFDVGTIGHDVYIAMEFVQGQDLRSWLEAEQRSWRDILTQFVAAAAGLTAAHEAGIVHRDFKADNALVGDDGRLRVIDFGVAHKASDTLPVSSSTSPALAEALGRTPNVETNPGTLMGTPLYMAPEQFVSDAVDERTDQFNFCASLFEALFDRPPFDGDSLAELMIAVTNNRVCTVPEDSQVPRWLSEAVTKGLSTEREQRYKSMVELVSAITPPVRRSRNVALWASMVVVALAIVTTIVLSRRTRASSAACEGLAAPIEQVWSPSRQGEVRTALLASKLSYASATWTRVKRDIDSYVAQWTAGRKQACQATSVRKEQTAQMLGRRMACYDQRLRELDAVVTVIASAESKMVRHAARAAASLSSVSRCANQSRLLAAIDEPVTRANEATVSRLRDSLATIKALQSAGQYRAAANLARSTYSRASKVAWRSGVARSAFWLGDLESRLGKHAVAEEHLFEAVRVASEHDDHATQALAWVGLTHVAAVGREHHALGARWAKHAAVAIKRGGGDRVLQGRLRFTLGHIEMRRLDFEAALTEYKTAAALLTRVLGGQHYLVAGAVGAQGSALKRLGRYDKAAKTQRRAAVLMERSMGAGHPHLAVIKNNLGNALIRLGDTAGAQSAYESSIAIRIAALGKDHLGVASPTINLGRLLERLGNYKTALRHYERALEIRSKALPPNHPRLSSVLEHLALLRAKQGRFAEVLSLRRRVVTMSTSHYGATSWRTAVVRGLYCDALRQQRQTAKAQRECRFALVHLRGKKHQSYLATALTASARLAVDLGTNARSAVGKRIVTELEWALALRKKRKQAAQFIAYSQFVLAQLLWTSSAARPRALRLAQEALAALVAALPGDGYRRGDVQRWLNQHPLP